MPYRCRVAAIVVGLSLIALSGCVPKKPPYLVQQYTIEYGPPLTKGMDRVEGSIGVERFSVSQSFNTTAMVYRSGDYQVSVYNYHRWRVNPGDMVTDFLLRDFRKGRAFGPVFSYRDMVKPRFVLQGGVEQFLLVQKNGRAEALLQIFVSLLDNREKGVDSRVIFQKAYSYTEFSLENTPEAFARGMSSAMARFSAELTRDVHEALRGRTP